MDLSALWTDTFPAHRGFDFPFGSLWVLGVDVQEPPDVGSLHGRDEHRGGGVFVMISFREGRLTPIILEEGGRGGHADPVPQAVILTAIVIGFSIQALLLVAIMKISRDHPTLEVESLEEALGS